ncbi:MAG: hypothetical protein QOF73_2374 [Thermomicrobiales bacterium]|nr:hypothetical protein [Thermomicrobiales bacterium]
MSCEVETSPRFVRKAGRILRKHPDLRNDFEGAVEALRQDPFQPSLRLHPLQGHLQGLHAARLSYEFRVVLVLRIKERRVTLINIGSHDEVNGDSGGL